MRRFGPTAVAIAVLIGSAWAEEQVPPTTPESVRALIQSGRYADAETQARAFLARTEREAGVDSVEAADVMDLVVEAMWRAGKGASTDCRDLASRAVEIERKRRGEDDPGFAKSLRTLGIVEDHRGNFASAKALLERSLKILEAALGPEDIEVAQGLNWLGNVLHSMTEEARAKALFERSLAIREKVLGKEHPDVSASLNNLGNVLDSTGDYSGARAMYERSLAIKEKVLGPDHVDLAMTLNNLAIVMYQSGDWVGARERYERALSIYQKRLSPEHPLVATTLHNLANVHADIGDLPGAKSLYERALAIRLKVLPADHPDVAASLDELAILSVRAKEYARAKSYFERSLAIWEKIDPDGPQTASGLQNFSGLLAETGDLPGAERLLERADSIWEAKRGPEHPLVAVAQNELGRIAGMMGDAAAAKAHFERARAISDKTLGLSHPLRAEILVNFARVEWALGSLGASLDGSLEAASIVRDHFRLTSRSLSEREALQYEAVLTPALDGAVSVLTSVDRNRLPPGAVGRVLDEVIRSRALVLDEMAARHRAPPEGDGAEVAQLRRDLVSARNNLARVVVADLDTDDAAESRARIGKARDRVEGAERDLARANPNYEKELARSRSGLQEVRRALPAGEALVAFLRCERWPDVRQDLRRPWDKTVPSYVAFVLRRDRDEPAVVSLGPAAVIEPLVARFRSEVASVPRGLQLAGSRAEARCRQAGARLRRAVWDPLTPELVNTDGVFVVPDGVLDLINMITLPTEPDRYLVETGPVLHDLTAERDLVTASLTRRLGSGILILGGADFDAGDHGAVVHGNVSRPHAGGRQPASDASDGVYRGPTSGCREFRRMTFKPLPKSLSEADELDALWSGNEGERGNGQGEALELTGADANEANFKRAASGRRVLHVATHGFFVDDHCEGASNPLLLSGLALAGANRRSEALRAEGSEDGILTADEIAALPLSGVEWVVLSGCDTGLGRVLPGEGVLGLRRAFQTAGAGTLIMSLWSVEDASTREWMRELYRNRLLGRSTMEAVRRANLAIIESRRRRKLSTHPFFWGAFVATGDWK